jgi:1-acyl-sn-glycerol-3-phosphate acyltransferase
VNAVRAVLFFVLVAPWTALSFTLCCVGLLLDPRRGRLADVASRLWARGVLLLAGARLVVTGAQRWEPKEPRVVVANHASYLDIPALMAAFPGPLRIVARKTLMWMPFVGAYIWLGGHFFVDRADARQALALAERVGERMRKRRVTALVFPEGTRSRDGRLAPVKTGALFLPLAAEVPVQPVAVLGSHAILPKGAWWPRGGGVVELRVGEPIATAGRGGTGARKALAAEVRDALLALGVPAGEA